MNSVVLSVENKKSSLFNKSLSFLAKYVLPFVIAALIVVTSGHARTTSRQGDFNKFTLAALFFLVAVFVVLFFIKTPTKMYKDFLHPLRNKLYKNPLTYFVLLPIVALAFFAIYYWQTGNSLTTVGHYLLLIAFGFCFAFVVPFKTFAKYFNKTLVFISIFSLIIYLMTLNGGDIPFYTSTFTSVNDIYYRSFLDVCFKADLTSPRNFGPFWEPGIYSLILTIGIVFELIGNEKPNWLNITIFTITILTTLSTSGVILLLLCVPLYFARKKARIPFYISFVISSILIFAFIYLGDPANEIPFFNEVFSKLFDSSSSNPSMVVRMHSPFYGFHLFFNSGCLGYGPEVFDEKYLALELFGNSGWIAQTSTFGWIAGSFGLLGLYFLVMFMFALFWFFFKEKNIRAALLMMIFAIVITNCEPMYSFSLFWIIAMYPIIYLVKKSYVRQGYVASLNESVVRADKGTRLTFTNVSGSLIIKILTLAIGLLTYPLYIKYFANQMPILEVNGTWTTYGAITLGAWLVILQILSWVLTFDMGIGNGLKNKIVAALNENKKEDIKRYISCSYITNFVIISIVLVIGIIAINFIDFSALLKIPTEVISLQNLRLAFTLAFVSICLEFFLKIVLNIYQALQKETIASAIPLLSTILLLIFVSAVKIESMSNALIVISVFYIFSVNLPLVVLTIVCFTYTLKDCKPSLKLWSFPIVKSIVGLGGLYFLIQIFLLIINSTNRVIISNSYGASVVTEYEPYLKIFSALTMIGSAISMPLWTLTLRADVIRDYVWMNRTKKMALLITIGFAFVSVLVVGFLQVIFNLWLREATIKVNYFKASMFAIWSVTTIASYFASAFSNGLQILKPQLIIYGSGAMLKIVLFIVLRTVIPNIDWITLVIVDSLIMLIAAITMFVLNQITINKRKSQFPKEVNNEYDK